MNEIGGASYVSSDVCFDDEWLKHERNSATVFGRTVQRKGVNMHATKFVGLAVLGSAAGLTLLLTGNFQYPGDTHQYHGGERIDRQPERSFLPKSYRGF